VRHPLPSIPSVTNHPGLYSFSIHLTLVSCIIHLAPSRVSSPSCIDLVVELRVHIYSLYWALFTVESSSLPPRKFGSLVSFLLCIYRTHVVFRFSFMGYDRYSVVGGCLVSLAQAKTKQASLSPICSFIYPIYTCSCIHLISFFACQQYHLTSRR